MHYAVSFYSLILQVLELITDKVELILPAKRLCTLEGQVIHAVTDIKDGEKYVALEGAR